MPSDLSDAARAMNAASVAAQPLPPRGPTDGPIKEGIYFAIESTGRYIKIGWSYRPGNRLRYLRYSAHRRFGSANVTYIGIICGTEKLEAQLHRRFAAHAVGAEWYTASAPLLEYIESLRPQFVPVGFFFYQRRASRKGGRPRSDKPRCACGAMTAKRAKARGHHC